MMSINPAIAHVLRNRSDFCHICGIKVKTTTWKEHRMGRQHRDSIQPLKEEFTGGQQQKAVPKRPVENGTTVPNEPAARSRKKSSIHCSHQRHGNANATVRRRRETSQRSNQCQPKWPVCPMISSKCRQRSQAE
ncbi:hypothetical protein QR680_012540 [Steinernema hermaphroditum]|uniref:U1-type domain-containing protein n=1 Tax=Steinernema hermaphroditum TaxID=289476 RepID=A0AA39M0P2_9BILA|nr:hypothetical protein QR680_012540 [Steinernema hermaphroditum]